MSNLGKAYSREGTGIRRWTDDLPSFCREIVDIDRPSSVIGIDLWVVEAADDVARAKERGERCAEEAIEYARRIGQPAFVDCVILYMAQSLHGRGELLGPMEKAFIARALQDDPHCIDRIIALDRHRLH
jgi:hypothetical protein